MTDVLVPFDDSPQSWDALDHACEQYPDADITTLHVLDFMEEANRAPMGTALPSHWESWYEEASEQAEELHADAQARAAESGVELSHATELGRPARTIVEYAEEHDVDHVVIGSHGRTGVSRVLLGSVAETVVRRAPCPVTVIRYSSH
ncbi:MAG: universal stress protein [Haloarculaceae archaeon]